MTKMRFTLECGHTREDRVHSKSALARGIVNHAPCKHGCGTQNITDRQTV